jgi:hypothetical protein
MIVQELSFPARQHLQLFEHARPVPVQQTGQGTVSEH